MGTSDFFNLRLKGIKVSFEQTGLLWAQIYGLFFIYKIIYGPLLKFKVKMLLLLPLISTAHLVNIKGKGSNGS